MHWRPGGDAYIGDMIPFFWDGEHHIFYLKRRGPEPYVWCHIKSPDLQTWHKLPDVVHPAADPAAPDARGCWTGSVVHHDGTFYCFYTGWNPDRPHLGKYPQTICLATSRDLLQWEKTSEAPILWPDDRWYLPTDWRDPYVFFNQAAGQWWMVICARDAAAAGPRAGALALATSDDLQRWEIHPPLWSGGVCHAPECPDLFAFADRWYAIYSHGITRYRTAADPSGPWLAAAPDTLDGPQVRAAKTLADDQGRRLLFGWVPTRQDESDGGALQWGGHMAIPRQLIARPDGALVPQLPAEFAAPGAAGDDALQLLPAPQPLRGRWSIQPDKLTADAPDGVALCRLDVPADFALSVEVELAGPIADAGFLVRMTETGDSGWKIGIERSASRLALYRWESWGDPEPLISRPVLRFNGRLRVHLFCHGSIIEVFVDGHASIAARAYAPPAGWLGLWAANGTARFAVCQITPLPPLQ